MAGRCPTEASRTARTGGQWSARVPVASATVRSGARTRGERFDDFAIRPGRSTGEAIAEATVVRRRTP